MAFVGANYVFGSVYDPKAPADRKKEWTWRLNYGYQADGNIVGEINTGDFSKSTVADTNLAGFTYGRLVNDGPRVDFYARLALFRHLERGAQDDFNSYAAYIMAMGKNYLAWTDRPFFRWGFGFGFNYAEEVPIAEQIKQANRDGETNQFLNYLEMQLDFSIDTITGGRGGSLRNCYLGATAWCTARVSGPLPTSWATYRAVRTGSPIHLECLQ